MSTDESATTPETKGRLGLVLLLALVGLALDQGTKAWAVAALTPGQYVPLLGDLLGLSLLFNPGAAFSFATGQTWVFTIIAALVVIVLVRYARRLSSTAWALAFALLLGGTLGNLGDRLFRAPGFARGHVVDFINYNGFFVGNVADIFIVVAAVLVAWLGFRNVGLDGRRLPAGGGDAASEPAAPDGPGTPDQNGTDGVEAGADEAGVDEAGADEAGVDEPDSRTRHDG